MQQQQPQQPRWMRSQERRHDCSKSSSTEATVGWHCLIQRRITSLPRRIPRMTVHIAAWQQGGMLQVGSGTLSMKTAGAAAWRRAALAQHRVIRVKLSSSISSQRELRGKARKTEGDSEELLPWKLQDFLLCAFAWLMTPVGHGCQLEAALVQASTVNGRAAANQGRWAGLPFHFLTL